MKNHKKPLVDLLTPPSKPSTTTPATNCAKTTPSFATSRPNANASMPNASTLKPKTKSCATRSVSRAKPSTCSKA